MNLIIQLMFYWLIWVQLVVAEFISLQPWLWQKQNFCSEHVLGTSEQLYHMAWQMIKSVGDPSSKSLLCLNWNYAWDISFYIPMSVCIRSSVVIFLPFTWCIFVFCNLGEERLICYIDYYYILPGWLRLIFGIELGKADSSSVDESLFGFSDDLDYVLMRNLNAHTSFVFYSKW